MQARDDVGNVYFMPGYVGDVQNNMRHGRVRKNPNGALLPVVRADRVPAPASQGQYTYENRFFVYEGEWRENVKHGIVDRMTMACPRTRSRSRACRPWQIADARWQRLRGGLRARRDNRAGTAELAERQFILGRVQAGGDGRAGRMDRQERRTPNAMLSCEPQSDCAQRDPEYSHAFPRRHSSRTTKARSGTPPVHEGARVLHAAHCICRRNGTKAHSRAICGTGALSSSVHPETGSVGARRRTSHWH